MKRKNIIMASILLVVAIVIGSLVATYFSYNNREIALRQQAEAQRGKIEGVHDKMWKIIQQKAQVTDEYKQTFEKIYPQLIAGRYQNDQGTMMKWIKESNPNFDVSLYRDLMQDIEIQRTEFQTSQERMLDIIREHETLTRTYPARWFVSNTMPIEYKVISSSRSKEVMTEGEDNDVDLFGKKKIKAYGTTRFPYPLLRVGCAAAVLSQADYMVGARRAYRPLAPCGRSDYMGV